MLFNKGGSCELTNSVSFQQCDILSSSVLRISQYLEYGASSGRMVHEWWIVEDFEGSRHGLIEVSFRHLSGGTEETKRDLGQESRCPGRKSKSAPPEQEMRALPVRIIIAHKYEYKIILLAGRIMAQQWWERRAMSVWLNSLLISKLLVTDRRESQWHFSHLSRYAVLDLYSRGYWMGSLRLRLFYPQ
jgi:hypothetical protein